MFRRIELVSGLLAGLLGLAGLGYTLFGPMHYQSATAEISLDGTRTETFTSGRFTLWQQGLQPRAAAFLALMGFCVVALAAGAYVHSRFGIKGALVQLCVSAVLLWGLVLVTGFSIGMFLPPAALLALLTSTLGT